MTPSQIEAVIRAELDAARLLHDCQQAVTRAMGEGVPAALLDPLVRAQSDALDHTVRSARARAQMLPDQSAVDRWIVSEPSLAPARRALVETARGLRRKIDREARRSAYLARRIALWNETQRAWIAEAVIRETRAEGYGPRSGGGLAATFDRTV
ncbi:MAG: hypothetical protein R3E12_13990 [Candidatus Eisenbacteria bacterium]